MIKLTRLNGHPIALNPDVILWADAAPDTTLRLTSGESVIVRESMDELVELVVAFRQPIAAKVLPSRDDITDPG